MPSVPSAATQSIALCADVVGVLGPCAANAGFSLPYAATVNNAATLFDVTQSGTGGVLKGAITEVSENPLILGRVQELLHSSVTVNVSFSVRDKAGAIVIGEDADNDGTPEGDLVRTGYAEFTPSRGESRETAIDECLRDLAELVVAELAARDDDRYEDDDEASEAKPLAFGRQVALQQRDPDWFAVTVPAGRRGP